MSRNTRQQGYSLLAMALIVLLLGLGVSQVHDSQAFKQALLLEQQGRQGKILEHIQSGLLGFAASQGFHSQSHLGHLPCPALLPDDAAQTACLNKPWGYLPVQSRIAINYLNSGIEPLNNELEPSTRKAWQYAVSTQLIQPNQMNWGRWVDYSKPSITVRIPDEEDRIETDVAAVVAREVRPLVAHEYAITPPYMLIKVKDLQNQMSRVQKHQLQDTLQAWRQLNPGYAAALLDHENLVQQANTPGHYQAIDSACSCSCTKTRCSCNCSNTGKWRSPAACWGTASNCATQAGFSICTSSPTQPCIFAGTASMANDWPVSRFEPAAAINKSCRPTQRNQCPLSVNSTPCICNFSWPDNTRDSLGKFSLKLAPSS